MRCDAALRSPPFHPSRPLLSALSLHPGPHAPLRPAISPALSARRGPRGRLSAERALGAPLARLQEPVAVRFASGEVEPSPAPRPAPPHASPSPRCVGGGLRAPGVGGAGDRGLAWLRCGSSGVGRSAGIVDPFQAAASPGWMWGCCPGTAARIPSPVRGCWQRSGCALRVPVGCVRADVAFPL